MFIKISHFLTLPFVSCLFFSCSVGPDYKKPETILPTNFTNNSNNFQKTEKIAVDWWKVFDDEKLNSLVERGVKSNLTLESSVARLKEARALRNSALLDFFPVIKAGGNYEDFKRSAAQIGINGIPKSSLERSLYTANFDATWEIDVFGGLRRAYESNDAMLEAGQADLNGVRVSIIAEIARNYVDLRGFQEQLRIAQRNADNQAETVKLTEVLQTAGTGTELDTARAKAQFNQTRAVIPQFSANVEKSINRIAVLIAQQPENLRAEMLEKKDIPQLKKNLSITNPEQAIKNRPDVISAERNLAAATANIGAQISDYFPKINFNGSFSLIKDGASNFISDADRTHSFGPKLSWSFLDFAHVNARVEGAKAKTEGAYAEYKESILLALEDIENSLVTFSKQNESVTYLQLAVDQSKIANGLAKERYKSGMSDFLTVLDSEKRLLEIQTSYAEGLAKASTALVGVYKAFGGGWE